MDIKINIDPSVHTLNKLNEMYPWIPNEDQIRPTKIMNMLKENLMNNIKNDYKSTRDYILINLFNTEKEIINDKLVAKEPLVKLNHFDVCRFRYQIEPNTFHYIMWYTCSKNELTDEEITKNVEESIYNVIKTDKFNFVWYENPKMTINDIYHVQVFWIKL